MQAFGILFFFTEVVFHSRLIRFCKVGKSICTISLIGLIRFRKVFESLCFLDVKNLTWADEICKHLVWPYSCHVALLRANIVHQGVARKALPGSTISNSVSQNIRNRKHKEFTKFRPNSAKFRRISAEFD